MNPETATQSTPGNGSVTITYFTAAQSADWSCHDTAMLIDSTTPNLHSVDVPSLCSGGALAIVRWDLVSQAGVGHVNFSATNPGATTYGTDVGQYGVGTVTFRLTDVMGRTHDAKVTFLVAPGGDISLNSGGLALDGDTGNVGDPVVAETPTGRRSQQWRFVANADGTLTLGNGAHGECLAAIGGGDTPGTPFNLDACEAANNPVRAAATADGSAFTLTDAASGLPIAFEADSVGSQLVLGDANDAATWTIASPDATSATLLKRYRTSLSALGARFDGRSLVLGTIRKGALPWGTPVRVKIDPAGGNLPTITRTIRAKGDRGAVRVSVPLPRKHRATLRQSGRLRVSTTVRVGLAEQHAQRKINRTLRSKRR
jgi:hypothetical protein